ncbi:hypothetical protein BJ875DRAFT_473934 [Amylocarpus encephaloides]|uniref:2EXR domain-containing protein n=1 Tax=Amylocarpus encephaloides TaxID=45428 RepID=A0A9P7YAU5_9HELO|nr:hypothetical protein BJ875DRAFT_473934 [Amylocarpus encephaloides]
MSNLEGQIVPETQRHETPSSTPETPTDELQQLAINDRNTPDFPLFTSLPAELRIKIWKYSFMPRRIMMKRHTSRPQLSICFVGNLLLVNSEAHGVVVENYARCLHDYGLPGVYINYSIDTICFSSGFKSLRILTALYPKFMAHLQSIEIPPTSHIPLHIDLSSQLARMSSLKVITVRYPHAPALKPWQSQEGWFWAHGDDVYQTISCLRNSLMEIGVFQKAKLAAFFSPLELKLEGMCSNFAEERSHHPNGLTGASLMPPSEELLDKLEIDMPENQAEIWPGRDHLSSNGWFVYEINCGSVD